MKRLSDFRFDYNMLLGWSAFFGAIGVILVVSYAATPTPNAVIEPETGTLAGAASVIDDSTASATKAVRFDGPVVDPLPCTSGVCMPKGDVTSNGHTWHQIVAEDFTKDAGLGTWGNSTCTKKDVYTGANGATWSAYPSCFKDTYQKRPYRSDQVLSVHDGALDFWLHTVDGLPAGAAPAPNMPDGTEYQTYGRYSARFKTTGTLTEFYQAWLLWPNDNTVGKCAESDYPEAQLSSVTVSAFNHYCDATGTGAQSAFSKIAADRTQWHTYTTEWAPGSRTYYLDGTLVGTAKTNIWDKPERWQLQTETKTTCDQTTPTTCDDDGHLLLDWAVVYSY